MNLCPSSRAGESLTNVYFKQITTKDEIHADAEELLRTIVEKEGILLERKIPIKVHFGEEKNVTYISPTYYEGIIDYLKENGIESCFIETNVLYRGERNSRRKHILLAYRHGFTKIPVVIADGEIGEEYTNIEINKKNLSSCKIAQKIAEQKQMIVVSHFKGHIGAGFGGAIKQLGMGCAARGGKLEQHTNTIPIINPIECNKCNRCKKQCPVDALNIGLLPRIDKKRCIGCASCISICPKGAIKINWLGSISKNFYERMAEYAYAAHNGKKNIYLTFAINITRNCDCEGHKMKPFLKDLGIFASTDPVAIDMECLDKLSEREKRKIFNRGRYVLDYAQEIGLGEKDYNLIEIL
jgi:hypothetical protein